MDYSPGVYDYANNMNYGNFQPFPGYPYLANLATRAEYRAFASTMSTEITREWIKFSGVGDNNDENPRIKELENAVREFNLQEVFRTAAEHDCFFGRGQIAINIRGAKEELPLVLSPATVAKNSLKGFKAVEPIWTTPSAYNSLDPLAPDFYKPRQWFMLGKEVHASRLLTIITRPLPDMLKPAYNFSGMSLSQLAEPYVENWLRTRQSVSDLINNFSITALATSMDQVLQGNDDGADVFARADLFTLTRSNRGLMLLDKEREELIQVNTPLSGLHELQAQAQEHQCLLAGSLIETRRGQVKIEDVQESDEVMTSNGYAPVEWAGVTGRSVRIVEIESEGSTLHLTEDHPVWSETKKDFVLARNVDLSHRLKRSPGWESMGSLLHGAGGFGVQPKQVTTGTQKPEGFCIECCTKPMSAKSLATKKSIIGMAAGITTRLKTWLFSLTRSTQQCTSQEAGRCSCRKQSKIAPCVEKATKPCGQTGQNIAQTNASKGHSSGKISSILYRDLAEPVPVYNIKVKDGHLPEFYANGILVHNCSVSRIPAVILTGISPSGLNASSDGEIRTFYDWVSALQDAFFKHPLDICIKLIMLDLWGEIDEGITFEFCPLWQMSEKEESEIRVNNANADGTYLDRQVVSQEEVRARLAADPQSGFSGIDVEAGPEIDAFGLGDVVDLAGEEPPVEEA